MHSMGGLGATAPRVCDAMNPVMTRHGFAPGQSGVGADTFQVLFCAGYDDFLDRFPTHDHTDYQRGMGARDDLHVNGSSGTLTDSDLEGMALGDVLRTAGLTDTAAPVDGIAELALDDAIQTIATAVRLLFRSPLS